MAIALRYFKDFELWIYLALAIASLYFLLRFSMAWQELHGAAFGLERQKAQDKLNLAAGGLAVLIILALGVFVTVSFIAPTVLETSALLTPTLDLLATATITLPAGSATPAFGGGDTAPAQTPTPPPACLPGQIALTQPKEGEIVGEKVEVIGSANIPNFGFYKLEMKRPEETAWLTILAGNEIRQEAVLGVWNTSLLVPGAYQLSLVVVDNEGRPAAPCIIQVLVQPAAPAP
jgi:hypothetical protein